MTKVSMIGRHDSLLVTPPSLLTCKRKSRKNEKHFIFLKMEKLKIQLVSHKGD